MSPKPFRFGATIVPRDSRLAWEESARRIEAAGYSNLTVMDHFGASGIWGPLVAAHRAAPSLRVGTIVLNGDLWNPSLAAREAATVDMLTDGSLELGVGAGWSEADYHAAGVLRDPPATRIARLEEALQIMRLAFSGAPVRFEGSHYTVDGGEPWPAPVQAHLPILVGGGARPILELAGRHADIVSIHRNLQDGVAASWSDDLSERDAVARRVRWVRNAAKGRFELLELHAIVLKAIVTTDRVGAAASVAAGHALAPEQILASPHFLIGTVDEISADLVARRERWGINYWTIVDGNDHEAFGPVARRLTGT